MSDVRGASLAAHAAARAAKRNRPATFAARAAGQAVATAHVPQHAFGGAYYALKALAALDPPNAEGILARELNWQLQRTPKHLRKEVQKRVVLVKTQSGIIVKVQKGDGY